MTTVIPEHLLVTFNEINSNIIYISTIEVDFKFRGKGIFKKFLEDLSKEFKIIELNCFPTLIPMYEHLGFKDMGLDDDEGYHLMRKEL